jgi:hypothetical protein
MHASQHRATSAEMVDALQTLLALLSREWPRRGDGARVYEVVPARVLNDAQVAVKVDQLDRALWADALVPRQQLPHRPNGDAQVPDEVGNLEASLAGERP